MPPPYCYDYPRPEVTVDLAAFARDGSDLRVLLVRRKHDPFAGRWALPGGFLDIEEPIEAAARRELKEETGIELIGPVEFIGLFGDPGRDPRGRTISLAHAAAVPGGPPKAAGSDDAAEAAWLDPWTASGLAFDHDAILKSALGWLVRQVEAGPAALNLLPDEFGLGEVHALFKAVHIPEDHGAAWAETMTRTGFLTALAGEAAGYRKRSKVSKEKGRT